MPGSSLGRSLPRPDALDKVTGAARYAGDRWPDGVLHAFVVFTDQPHARILTLDVAAAETAEGVRCVLTAADVPVNEYGLTMFDQPVLVGPGSTPAGRVPQDVSRWEADHLAVVVAETYELAQAAADLIRAEWEPLPVLADIDAALADGAPLLHPEHPSGSNRYHGYKILKGDIDAAFAKADVVIEGTYEFPFQEHAYLQPEAGLAYLDDLGRITLEVGGQWTHEDQEQVAHALDVPAEEIRIIYPPIGGAFGGREDMSLQIVLALAVSKLRDEGLERPVRCQWSREESIVGHHKRHRGRVHARLAATRDGIILGVEATSHLDAGGYNYTSNKVLGNLHLSVAGPYEVPAARLDSYVVYTNAIPGGAFRGFGGPQGCFVAETQMNRLAAALHLDPVEVRRRNLLGDGSIGITSTVMPPGVSLPDVVEVCAETADWERPPPPPQPLQAFASL
ncbi:MAG: molybdopterin-dependent oxidoreductase, partial [Actinomycetota bacterium]|nr:molybdopterin-dependent oxidoreductase [Actinomycetota bacterium]